MAKSKLAKLNSKYSGGGKPMGSTGLFAKGGKSDKSEYRVVHITNEDDEIYPKGWYVFEVDKATSEKLWGSKKFDNEADANTMQKHLQKNIKYNTKKLADGGKPIGSTGLFAKGGKPKGKVYTEQWEELADYGDEEFFIREFGTVGMHKKDKKVQIPLVLVAEISNMLEKTGEERFEEKPFVVQFDIAVHPSYISKKLLKEASPDNDANDLDSQFLDLINSYMGGVPVLDDSLVQSFATIEEAREFMKSKEAVEKLEAKKIMIGFYLDGAYNRMGSPRWNILEVMIGERESMYAKGGRTKSSIVADKNIKALHPGKRISDTGNEYYENRANRSDSDRRKKFAEGGVADYENRDSYDDYEAARDVELFAENNQQLYKSRWIPIIQNLKRKKDKGVFDEDKAAILFKYYVEDADKKYQKEINGNTPKGYFLSVKDRKLLSKKLAHDFTFMSDADMTFEQGGKVNDENIRELFDKVTEVGAEIVEEFVDDNSGFGYEDYYNKRTEEIEHRHVSGFIPFTNGGSTTSWFEAYSSLLGSGKTLPTNTLQAQMEKIQEDGYREAADKFKKEYPEIVEQIGEDKINYHDLQEEGFNDEADELDNWEREWIEDETALMSVQFILYKGSNSRAIDGKPTCVVMGIVNLEAPYHRDGNLEDFIEESFTFHNEEGFKKKLATALVKVKDWFEGSHRDQGRELSIRRMKQGGSASPVNYAELPNEFARGGAVKIPNIEAKDYSSQRKDFRANNLEGKTLDNGDYVVLSYGHYPIWWWNKDENKWYSNSSKYSVTTSKQTGQSRPSMDVISLTHQELLEKMSEYNAKFDLGGMMIKIPTPMSVDNTLSAHAGSPISSQQQSGL